MKKLRIPAIVIMVIIASVFYTLAVQECKDMKWHQNRISFVNENDHDNIDVKEANYRLNMNMLKAKPFDMIFWTDEKMDYVESTDIGIKRKIPIIPLCGNLKIILRGNAIDGEIKQEKECILGKQTAFLLFGGQDVIGLKVSYNKKNYIIVDVEKTIKDGFFYQPEINSNIRFNRTTVSINNREEKIVVKNRFINTYGYKNILDFELLIFIMEISLLVLPWVFWWKFLKVVKKRNTIVCIVGVWVGIFFTIIILNFPIDFIPTKWSDFGFWGELFKSKKMSLELFLRLKLSELDLNFFRQWFKCIGLYLASILFTKVTSILYKMEKGENNDANFVKAYWKNL